LFFVQLAFPACDDKRCHSIANEIRQRSTLGHEAVDAKDKRHTGDGHRRNDGQRGGKRDEARASDTGPRPWRRANGDSDGRSFRKAAQGLSQSSVAAT
jgi:hypothetical protein